MYKLKLKKGAFISALQEIAVPGQIGWSAKHHYELVHRLLGDLRDEDGHSLELSKEQEMLIEVVFRPNEDVYRRVLQYLFGLSEHVLDEEARKTFEALFGMSQFSAKLAKMKNPVTKQPFITKKSKGSKLETLEALLDEAEAADSDNQSNEAATSEPGETESGEGPVTTAANPKTDAPSKPKR